jgi:hypothetical protein
VDGDALKTECDPKGLGLLVYKKERFGNCQLRIVFKTKTAKSNSGVYVRIADGILDQVSQPGAAFDRNTAGKISKPSMQNMMASAEREEGPWFAVHRGHEVQIMDYNDKFHRTGAIYSLAPASAAGCGGEMNCGIEREPRAGLRAVVASSAARFAAFSRSISQ